jgi:hypothetical protein
MPRATPIQTSFVAGELSPLLLGRPDLNKYAAGAETLENFVVLPQGGVQRRYGLKDLGTPHDVDVRGRLIPFIFSRTQRYVLEFSALAIRIFKDGVLLEDGGDPIVVTTEYTEEELPSIRYVQSADVLFLAHANHPLMRFSRYAEDDWRLEEVDLWDGPYLDANEDENVQLTVTTLSDTIELHASANTFVVGDVGKYIEFKENDRWRLGQISIYTGPRQVTITGQTPYDMVIELGLGTFVSTSGNTLITNPGSFTPYDAYKYVRTAWNAATPYWYRLNPGALVDEPSRFDGTLVTPVLSPAAIITRGKRTITVQLDANADVFVATDVGRHIRLGFNSKWTWGKISHFIGVRQVWVALEAPLPRDETDVTRISNGGVTDNFRLGAWSDTTGWPTIITLHDQRLVLAASALQPSTFWMSEVDDYESYSPTDLDGQVLDTNAVTYTIATAEVNPILWMTSGPTLLIGTAAAEVQVRAASSVNEPITPKNIVAPRQTGHGGQLLANAIRVGSATLFLSATGTKLFELTYSFENDAFVSRELTIFAEHVLRTSGACELAYHDEPHGVVWVRKNDDTLIGLTYVRDQEVLAWHRHAFAYSSVESICIVPDGDAGEYDMLYLLVNTVHGRRICRLPMHEVNAGSAAFDLMERPFLDLHVQRVLFATTTIPDLDHLNGLWVDVLVDGEYVGQFFVEGGEVTLGESTTGTAIVGLRYDSVLRTLPLDAGSVTGTGIAKIGRIEEVGLRVHRSLPFLQRSLGDNLFTPVAIEPGIEPPAYDDYVTGVVKFTLNMGYDTVQQFEVKQQWPYPLTILACMPEQKTNE